MGIVDALGDFFKGTDKSKALTSADVKKDYQELPSFTNLLPWREYDADNKVFLLEDGRGVGSLFTLEQIGVEAKSDEFLADIQDKLQSCIAEAIPEDHVAPWTLQFFVQDELSVRTLGDQLREYCSERAKGTQYTETYIKIMEEHLLQVGQKNGIFRDDVVTGQSWQANNRKVRMCLYRYQPVGATVDYERDVRELVRVRKRLMAQLVAAGAKPKLKGGQELYEWMLRWLNPNPILTKGDSEALLKAAPYPGDNSLAYGYDLAEQLMLSRPESSNEKGIWYFDGLPHKAVSVQALRRVPENGVLTAERQSGESIYAMFDRMPEGTIMSMTIEIKPRDVVQNHITKILHSSVGDNAQAELAKEEAKIAQTKIVSNNPLYPVYMTFLAKGDNEGKLEDAVSEIESLLLGNYLQAISENQDLIQQDMYIRAMPMKFDCLMMSKKQRRSRLVFSSQIASLLPLYGRSKGTGNPALMYWNRGGEPLLVDPFNSEDRSKNAHALIIGPTGAGKSATCVDALMKIMAVHRPRLFIIDAGNSFGLLGNYFASQDLTVNQMEIKAKNNPSLPPFTNAMKVLEMSEKDLEDVREDDETEEGEEEDESRDYLGEMEIAARIMITGGEKKENDRLRRADRMIIRRAIFQAAKKVRDNEGDQVITKDVVDALHDLEGLDPSRKSKADEMADAMELFCEGLAGELFNRKGTDWKDCDVTIFDMGILAREGNEDQLTVAYMGLMNHIHGLVEKVQYEGRPTLMLTDEGHIITKNALLAPYVIKVVKMWRKLGAWYWIATQGLGDFPNDSRNMLSMLEWWVCLVMPRDEIEEVARFKNLTEAQKNKLLAARKSARKYTEGVILTDNMDPLFRNIPPALALALAMTEQEEKAQRRNIMDKLGCDELAAAEEVAKLIRNLRKEYGENPDEY